MDKTYIEVLNDVFATTESARAEAEAALGRGELVSHVALAYLARIEVVMYVASRTLNQASMAGMRGEH